MDISSRRSSRRKSCTGATDKEVKLLVYEARIEVPEDISYEELMEAQLTAPWECKGVKHSKEERMSRTDLSNKCGSCRHFIERPDLTSSCYGKCLKGKKGYKVRTNRACKEYQRR